MITSPRSTAGQLAIRFASCSLLAVQVWLCGCAAPRETQPAGLSLQQRLIDDSRGELLKPSSLEQARSWKLWSFTDSADLEPWEILRVRETPKIRNQRLELISEQGYPRLVRRVNFASDEVEALRVNLEGFGRGQIRIFWARAGEVFHEDRGMVLNAQQHEPGQPAVYTFRLLDHTHWRGQIRHLRFDLGSIPETRVRLRSIEALALDSDPAELAAAVGRPWRVDLGHDVRPALLALPGVPIERPLQVPDAGGQLRLAWALGAGARAPLRFSARVRNTEGEESIVLEGEMAPPPEGEQPSWQESRLDLSPWAGQELELVLATERLGEGEPDALRDLAFWSGLEVLGQASEDLPPSLALVIMDTLRADRLSLYGNPRTTSPNIDAWARDHGVTFLQTVAPAPWTLPSHISMFTGLDPLSHGLNHDLPAPPSLEMLAESLRAQGYTTVAITGGVYLHPRFGLDQGFDRFVYWPPSRPQGEELADNLQRALELLDEPLPRPFFFLFHTYEVHTPFHAREPYLTDMVGEEASAEASAVAAELATRIVPLAKDEGFVTKRHFVLRDGADDRSLPAEQQHRVVDLYDASIAYADQHIGQLLRALDSYQDQAGGLAVALTSDHGEALGEEGLAGHSYLEDWNLMVPFVLSLPGGERAGQAVPNQVRTVDLAPTFLELAGISPAEGLDGQSVLDLARRPGASFPREAWAYASSSNLGIALRMGGRLKYVFNNTAWPPVRGQERIYQLPDHQPTSMEGAEQSELESLRQRMSERYQQSFRGLITSLHNSDTVPWTVGFVGPRLLAPSRVKVVRGAPGELEWRGRGRGFELRLPAGQSSQLYIEGVRPESKLDLEILRPTYPECRVTLTGEDLANTTLDLNAGNCEQRSDASAASEALAAPQSTRSDSRIHVRLSRSLPQAATASPLDPDMQEKLRSLGYLD